jgi:small subunit ribosomal protein S12e
LLLPFHPSFQVEESKQLGEWVGLCKLDAEGKARKVVGCSCVVVKSWGEESRARTLLVEALEQM